MAPRIGGFPSPSRRAASKWNPFLEQFFDPFGRILSLSAFCFVFTNFPFCGIINCFRKLTVKGGPPMARKCLPLLLALCLLLAACGPGRRPPGRRHLGPGGHHLPCLPLCRRGHSRGGERHPHPDDRPAHQSPPRLHPHRQGHEGPGTGRRHPPQRRGAGGGHGRRPGLRLRHPPRSTAPKTSPCWRGAESDHHHEEGILPAGHEHEADPPRLDGPPTGPAR